MWFTFSSRHKSPCINTSVWDKSSDSFSVKNGSGMRNSINFSAVSSEALASTSGFLLYSDLPWVCLLHIDHFSGSPILWCVSCFWSLNKFLLLVLIPLVNCMFHVGLLYYGFMFILPMFMLSSIFLLNITPSFEEYNFTPDSLLLFVFFSCIGFFVFWLNIFNW